MSRVCEICGKGPATGNVIVRKGSPKYKGGIGLHTTGITKRRFLPNLRSVRVAARRFRPHGTAALFLPGCAAVGLLGGWVVSTNHEFWYTTQQ